LGLSPDTGRGGQSGRSQIARAFSTEEKAALLAEARLRLSPASYPALCPAASFKTAWAKVKEQAGIAGCWHDGRHTFITDLAESGEVSDETIRDMAGHVSKPVPSGQRTV